MKKAVLPILVATYWISISQFVRNTFLLNDYWLENYQNLGLLFPEQPINGAVFGICSFYFAIAIFIFSKKINLWQTAFLSRLVGFKLMRLVCGHLGFLSFAILPIAIPIRYVRSFYGMPFF